MYRFLIVSVVVTTRLKATSGSVSDENTNIRYLFSIDAIRIAHHNPGIADNLRWSSRLIKGYSSVKSSLLKHYV